MIVLLYCLYYEQIKEGNKSRFSSRHSRAAFRIESGDSIPSDPCILRATNHRTLIQNQPFVTKSPTYNLAIPAIAIAALRCALYFLPFFSAHLVIIYSLMKLDRNTDSTPTGGSREHILQLCRVYSKGDNSLASYLIISI